MLQWGNNSLVGFCNGTVTQTGRLVNASAKIASMNSQVFLHYFGICGSPGFLFESSGYWDPAFNETATQGAFITAWCGGDKNGMVQNSMVNVDTQRECYPYVRSR